jgi:hypothetical protein
VAAAGGRVGSAATQGSVDRFQDTLQVSIYITVPKTQHLKYIRKKFRVTPHIAPPVSPKICWPPSTSMMSRCFMQTKSTMACLRGDCRLK